MFVWVKPRVLKYIIQIKILIFLLLTQHPCTLAFVTQHFKLYFSGNKDSLNNLKTLKKTKSMKKVIYFLACLPFTFACTKSSENKINNGDEVAEYALPLDTAVSYITRYDSIVKHVLNNDIPVKAYTIRAIDLMESLGIPLEDTANVKYKHIRVYLGMDAGNNFRLMLTPVKDANIEAGVPGEDVILDGSYTASTRDAGDPINIGQYVMDFTGPCPNSCPSNTPLMPEN